MAGNIIANNRDTIFRDASGNKVQRVSAGGIIDGVAYDALTATYPSALVEEYRYYIGGVSGTLQATVTVTYQDVEKCIVTSVVRT